jgi:D-galactarolactone cycloisomerase
MKIVDVESYVLTDKLEETFYFSQWEYSERKICIVKITTDSGHVGWGEGYGPATVLKAGIDYLRQFIIGMDPLQSEVIWHKLYRRTLDYARRGILMASVSALDVAVWDLKGKILEEPVHLLLGGKKRDELLPYATGLYFRDSTALTDALVEEALHYKSLGYRAIKMKVGLGIEKDIEHVSRVREAIGPDIHLMIDSNHAFNLREAALLARALEKYNLYWFEEPISPEYYKQYAELRSKTSIPIAGGECEYLQYGFLQLLQNNSVDIVQPDICAAGGLTEVKRIAGLADAYGVEVVPHTWGTGIAISAEIHFVSNLNAIPGRLMGPDFLIEYDCTENGLREELTKVDYQFKNGKIIVPDTPGLGFEVNMDVINKYLTK